LARPKSSSFAPLPVIVTLPGLGIGGDVIGKDLDGDRPVETGIARLVDLSHAARRAASGSRPA
jgi:hypothetical protein